jgi:DNA ligase (NAD+)
VTARKAVRKRAAAAIPAAASAAVTADGAAAARQRVAALRRDIARHNRLYYQDASPEIADTEYDALLRELQDLEAAYPELRRADSPTERVGGAPDRAFPTVRHSAPMLSLDNTYSVEEVRAFHARPVALLGGAEPAYVVEPKLDGVAVSLLYENGAYQRAVTRGDGIQGDDITRNVATLRNLPQRVRVDWRRLEVRGEIYMPVAASSLTTRAALKPVRRRSRIRATRPPARSRCSIRPRSRRGRSRSASIRSSMPRCSGLAASGKCWRRCAARVSRSTTRTCAAPISKRRWLPLRRSKRGARACRIRSTARC